MLHLYENGVEILRKKLNDKKLESYWNNYNFIVWKKDQGGFYNTKGVFRNNSWGVADEFPVSQKGTWVLPLKYVKYFK
jgi:hypothetical protein